MKLAVFFVSVQKVHEPRAKKPKSCRCRKWWMFIWFTTWCVAKPNSRLKFINFVRYTVNSSRLGVALDDGLRRKWALFRLSHSLPRIYRKNVKNHYFYLKIKLIFPDIFLKNLLSFLLNTSYYQISHQKTQQRQPSEGWQRSLPKYLESNRSGLAEWKIRLFALSLSFHLSCVWPIVTAERVFSMLHFLRICKSGTRTSKNRNHGVYLTQQWRINKHENRWSFLMRTVRRLRASLYFRFLMGTGLGSMLKNHSNECCAHRSLHPFWLE